MIEVFLVATVMLESGEGLGDAISKRAVAENVFDIAIGAAFG